MAGENKGKKIKRSKDLKSLEKIRNAKGAGRIPDEEKELNEEQKELAKLVGQGLTVEAAGKFLGFSYYKINKYPAHPLFENEVEKWKQIWAESGLSQVRPLLEELNVSIIQELNKRVSGNKKEVNKGDVTEATLLKLFDKVMIYCGIVAEAAEEVTEATQTVTRKTKAGRPKQLPQPQEDSEEDFEEDLITDEDIEPVETEETTIQSLKKQRKNK